MIVIENNIIPVKGFKAMNFCGILFLRKGCKMNDVDMNHEKIHSKQIWEMLILPFYIWYVLEWIIRLFQYSSAHKAYRNISFEREAYTNQNNLKYKHPFYGWLKYIKL